MVEIVVIYILLVFLLYYLTFLWSIWKGLSSLSNPRSDATPFSSVIIAARNEEKNIEQCLRALIGQSYDPAKFEVIVVDDHSQDNTVQRANHLAESISNPRITVVSLKDQSGKPGAIAHGVSQSKGEVILCTDADCIVPKTWVELMVGCLAPTVAFVAGPVLELPSSSLLSRLQAIEYLSLTTTAAGLIGFGNPIICSGASIAYRKSAFTFVNGYGDRSASCDDETLMQRMVVRRAGRVAFNSDASAIVSTKTPSSLSEFWRQRTRWATKKGRYEDSSVLVRLVLLYGFFFVLFAAGTIALVEPVLRLPVIGVLLLKGVAEFLVLSRGARLFRHSLPIGQFLIAELFHVPYIAAAGLIGQFSSLRWKDRNVDR
jgi:cellulose synthase/poly-beta-1,6-N-acetylglucosamine synthase-like glycosyltransferase